MNKPYINVEAILEMFHQTGQDSASEASTADSLNWLTEFLAREHSTMNAQDWHRLVQVGAALYRAQHTAESAQQTH